LIGVLQNMVSQLSGIAGMLVRPRWQPMPPTQPPVDTTWAAVGIIKTEADGFPYIAHDGATTLAGQTNPGVDRMQRHSTITLMATFYGPQAEDAAAGFRDALYVPQNREPLMGVGVKLLGVHDLTRAPEIINQQYIDRIDLQIDLRQQIDRVYPVFNLNGAVIDIRADTGATANVVVTPPPP
jgi:hypothetical protein